MTKLNNCFIIKSMFLLLKLYFYKYEGVSMKNFNKAFTLAEVLITLGIIGIVAAMTLPTVLSKYREQVVLTKLKRVYSVMNQAITSSMVDNGSTLYWENTLDPIDFYNKYYKGYLKVTKIEELGEANDNGILLYFADGSLLKCFRQGRDYNFFIDNKRYKNDPESLIYGKDVFSFRFDDDLGAQTAVEAKFHIGKKFEPYKHAWDGTEETLYTDTNFGCNNKKHYSGQQADYCTALIQYHNWSIPEDYPIKF